MRYVGEILHVTAIKQPGMQLKTGHRRESTLSVNILFFLSISVYLNGVNV